MVYSIQDFLYQMESAGIFDFLFPFLLVFAVVFGILSSINFFGKNKGVNVLVALIVGFMAIRFGWFTQFYSEVFPRVGIGITIMLAIMILVGMFIEKEYQRYWLYGLSALAGVIAIIIFYQTFATLGWTGGAFGGEAVGWIIGAVLIIGLIIAVANSGGDGESSSSKVKSINVQVPARFN